MEVTSIPNSGGTCLQVRGALTIADLDPLRDALLEALHRSPTLLLDLSGVDECDAAGIQLLCSARNHPAVRIGSLPTPISETAAALGLSTEALIAEDATDGI